MSGFAIAGTMSYPAYGRWTPAFLDLGARLGHGGSAAMLLVALASVAACYGLRLWGSSYLHAGVVWNPDARTDSLVIAGPFRFTRNPLYLGNLFMAIGFGLMAPIAGFVWIVAANVAFVLMLCFHEQHAMARAYGARFQAYAEQVPLLLPRLTPVPAEGAAHPSLSQGLLAEVFVLALIAGMFVMAADPRHGFQPFIAIYLAGLIAQRIIARSQRSS